jgi:ribosome-associated protein
VIYELIGKSPVAKHFVIATGTSDQQIKSLGMEMIKDAKQNETEIFTRAGMQQGKWIVIDLIDVVIHLFDGEYRKFYDLELLWGDAPLVKWERDETDS